MNNIALKNIKIDLHIHSFMSFDKDGDKVSSGTKEKIGTILVPKLEEKHVNLAAITDHNVFSYEYYEEFKRYENIGGFLEKVLPGIELDIDIGDTSKDTHAIAIFDDRNEEKIKKIETIISKKVSEVCSRDGKSKKNLLFSASDAIDIFRQIDLNFVLIVHQKSDPCNQNINQEHSIADNGIEKFNELVSYDYFDAVEFKNYRVEGFLKSHQSKYNKDYNALCGSDCHQWESYPQCDSNDTTVFNHCFLKALPTFKGLAMALTGVDRIHFVDTASREPYLDKIEFSIGGVKQPTISLSPGLNVLIGDNSIGKSFFLEALNNPEFKKENVPDSIFQKKLSGYKSFKSRLNFEINSKTFENDSDNVEFNRQGYIRSLFEGDNKSIEDLPFLSQFFGKIDSNASELEIDSIIKSFIDYGNIISNYLTLKGKVDNQSIIFQPKLLNIKPYNLSLLVDLDSITTVDYRPVISNVNSAIHYLDLMVKSSFIDKDDSSKISKIISYLNGLVKKYEKKNNLELFKAKSYSIVVEKFNEKIAFIENKSKEDERLANDYARSKNDFAKLIVSFFLAYEKNKNKELNIPEKIKIEEAKKSYDKYVFISKLKKTEITKNDILEMLKDPINRCDDFNTIKDIGFIELAKKFNSNTKNLQYSNAEDKYKNACLDYARKNWFQKEKGSIIRNNSISISGNSAGLNAQYYLDLYTLLERKKLFIVDQPEDDVSEARISKELKSIMREMAKREQIIFVTHNAELVVNLDVDNVIVFKTDKDNNLLVANGALEYEDGKINILNEVADLLDGGADIIKERWKRYEKNNYGD